MAEKSNVRKIVVAGVLSALSIALFLTPFGYIPWLAGASLTVMHVPAIIGAVLEGPRRRHRRRRHLRCHGLDQGGDRAPGADRPFFVNPLISVLPRLLVGLAAWAVYKAFGAKCSGRCGRRGHRRLADKQRPRARNPRRLCRDPARGRRRRLRGERPHRSRALAAVLTLAVVSAWKGIESRSGKAKLAKEE